MGGDSSKEDIKKINSNEWTKVGTENGADIVRSNMGHGQGELRVIQLDPKHQVNKQYQIYSYRKNSNSPLVKCLGAEFSKSENKTMCGNQQNVKVLTQRIPKRLSEISRLSFPQSLYVLSESLRGFEDLHNKAGVFQITDKMIGINKENEVKVWLNQNFAQNHPDHERPILQTTTTNYQDIFRGSQSQQKMVDTIISLVEQKTEQGRFPVQLKQKLKSSKKTFEETFNTIQNYIKGGSVFVPDKILGSSQQLGQMRSNSGGWNQQNTTSLLSPVAASTRVETYTPPPAVQLANDMQVNTNRFTYVSDQNKQGGNYTSGSSVNQITYAHTSQPVIYERPPTYTFSANQPTTSFSTLYPQPQTQTVNISSGNTYGITRVQSPYQIGGINGIGGINQTVQSRITTSPRSGAISFNYKSPTSTQFRQY